MTEQTDKADKPEPSASEKRAIRATDSALATSSPDVHHGFMQLIQKLFRSPSKLKVMSGALLSGLMMLFVVGLPAINGTTILIDKLAERAQAERSFQLEMFKLQTDVEIQKLDRQRIGDGAIATLNSISQKIEQQGVAIDAQGKRLEQLSLDVASVKSAQASDRRQISALSDRQRQTPQLMSVPQARR